MCCLNTCVDKASRCSLAELFWFIWQCDLNDPRDVSRRCLDADSVWCNQLKNMTGNRSNKLFPPCIVDIKAQYCGKTHLFNLPIKPLNKASHLTYISFWNKLQTVSSLVKKRPTSLHTSMLPNTTCSPSKKFSPMTMTMAPPVVQPSLGLMALIHGVAGD